ncbi:alcohol dehydrogenase catalytic domain-containing protein [Haloechinothrix sp. LS1_15]|uniref:alcohol dehydrogenase catalytic domain-containing protein n=1 Tax=Haloechinothrix sp. LS1_15 TaxID=2652248 RepID=UPI0029460EE0|nr:alcohol dehydrogenase catalytic domain-containing protein [Haloechinothrix sp. LS1_15]MDV6013743.1 alcohol dehydrogenase catalytic domain-containing protein [Haloechinothrix sp. LS1_15]
MVQAMIARGVDTEPEIGEVVLPEPGAEDVRVSVRAAGVCHSDLSMIDGVLSPSFPLVLGHEASGVVAEVGDEVTRVAVGDHVVLNWTPPCRACWFCQQQEPWLCTATEGITSVPRGALPDGTPSHVTLGVGALAEEVVVGENAVIPIPAELPLAESALVGCAVVTGVGAVRNNARVRPGESVVVIGIGGVGLSAIAGARLCGAGPIIAVDVSEAKRDLAMAAGATEFLVAEQGTAKAVRGLTEGRGADVALECVGRSQAIRTAWQCSRRGARIVVLGVGSKDDHVSFSGLELYHFARSISASVYGSADPDTDVPKLATAVRDGELDLNTLVTHRIGLADVPAAFERMRQGEGGRSLVLFG